MNNENFPFFFGTIMLFHLFVFASLLFHAYIVVCLHWIISLYKESHAEEKMLAFSPYSSSHNTLHTHIHLLVYIATHNCIFILFSIIKYYDFLLAALLPSLFWILLFSFRSNVFMHVITKIRWNLSMRRSKYVRCVDEKGFFSCFVFIILWARFSFLEQCWIIWIQLFGVSLSPSLSLCCLLEA